MTLLSADILSNFGDTVYYLALMNYVLLLPNSQLALSVLTFVEGIPLVAGILIGYLADRTKKKVDTIITTQVFRVIMYLLVGFIMSFKPALWIIIVAAVIKLVSDLSGYYENSLYTPISLRVISNEEREEATAFSSSVHATTGMFFNFCGAFLVGVLGYSMLAYLNAGTFMICAAVMFMMKPFILKLLKKNPLKTLDDEGHKEELSFFAKFKESLVFVFKEMMKIPEIRLSMVVGPALNALFAGLSVFVVLLSKEKDFIIYSSAMTIALVGISITLGQIAGNILLMTRLKNISLNTLLKLLVLGASLILFALWWHQSYLLMISLVFLGGLMGLNNPKLSALLMNAMPEEQIALVNNGVTSYFTLGMVVMQILLSGLILILPVDTIILGFFILSLGLVIYTFKEASIKRSENH